MAAWHLFTVAASGGLCEGEKFQEIVGGADHGPLGTYFLDAAQQELAEAARLFDSVRTPVPPLAFSIGKAFRSRRRRSFCASVRCGALPPRPARRRPPAPPSPPGSSPAVSPYRWRPGSIG